MQAALAGRPGSCIKWLGAGRRNEMRFTRFLRHDGVSVARIIGQASARTRALVAGRHILAIQDTSELVLGGRKKAAQGFGPVGKGGNLRGVLLHAVLAVDADDGSLLGLVDGQLRNRTGGKRVAPRSQRMLADKESQRMLADKESQRMLADKESQRWLDGAASASVILAAAEQIPQSRTGKAIFTKLSRKSPIMLSF